MAVAKKSSEGAPASQKRTKARWLMVFLAFSATSINYVDRANLGVAAPIMQKQLHLSSVQIGLILGAFFWTYAIFQLPSGWFIDRLGARIMYSVAVVWWSIFTAATALGRGFLSLMAVRLLLGVGKSGAYPSNSKIVSEWFPQRERAFATSIYDSGSRVGTALSLPVVTFLIAAYGWRSSFVVTGIAGLIWVAFWIWFYRRPREHAMANWAEVEYIESGGARSLQRETAAAEAGPQIGWLDLFRYRTIWGMMIGFFCLNFVIYFFITWFPSYLVDARHFSLLKLGIFGMIPALVAIPGGWLGGLVSDYLFRRGMSLTAARKICLVGGMVFSSVIALAVFVPSAAMALALLAISYASLTFAAASIWSLPADVAPTPGYVASIGGIQNFASNIAGIVITSFVGVALAHNHGSYVVPLVTSGVIAIVGALSYLLIVGKIEPLPLPDRKPALRPVSREGGAA